ncbi:FAD-dependent oxidoreductase [Methyloceanibacter stevinii]|uniref:FAD-dependent oxidoreductase n=1 Tax=Methyloceanibacter stevinii TaxID=1774970 RepID=A0A1E3VLC1_9HYPH|nr:FAD-binding oxidoreductase [Methyloceanibacter stevinii]ODR94317.1 FAD-dependent oxidoreductase [Methyloceanibacter stevinii]
MTETTANTLTLADLAAGRLDTGTPPIHEPYWWAAAPRQKTERPTLPMKADVVIIGSGFTGLSAALTLLDKGRSVVVLDKGVPGFGASTRNGGQIGSGNQKFRVKTLVSLRGEAKAVALLREGTRMLDYIEDLIARENIDCHFRRCGRFRGAMRPAHYEAMARDMEDLKRVAGVESFMVPRSEQHAEIRTDLFHGGSVLPQDASLHPGLYHAGLMARVAERGGAVVGLAGAKAINRESAGYRVSTEVGLIDCRQVLVATNGYTDTLFGHLRRRIVSIRSGLIATEQLQPGMIEQLLPGGRVYGNTNRVFYYFRAAPDQDRLVWGGRAARFGGLKAYRHLAEDLLSVFPDLGHVGVSHVWDGTIGYTYDELPHLGRSREGIHFAAGYCGTGVSRATYFGHKIALQMTDDPDGATAFDDLTFPAFPMRDVAQLAVPFIERWYRFRDSVEK